MKIKKEVLKSIFNDITKESGYIDFKEYHSLLDEILSMSKTDEVYITREYFQEKTSKIMDSFDDSDKATFLKIVVLAYLDNKIFN